MGERIFFALMCTALLYGSVTTAQSVTFRLSGSYQSSERSSKFSDPHQQSVSFFGSIGPKLSNGTGGFSLVNRTGADISVPVGGGLSFMHMNDKRFFEWGLGVGFYERNGKTLPTVVACGYYTTLPKKSTNYFGKVKYEKKGNLEVFGAMSYVGGGLKKLQGEWHNVSISYFLNNSFTIGFESLTKQMTGPAIRFFPVRNVSLRGCTNFRRSEVGISYSTHFQLEDGLPILRRHSSYTCPKLGQL